MAILPFLLYYLPSAVCSPALLSSLSISSSLSSVLLPSTSISSVRSLDSPRLSLLRPLLHCSAIYFIALFCSTFSLHRSRLLCSARVFITLSTSISSDSLASSLLPCVASHFFAPPPIAMIYPVPFFFFHLFCIALLRSCLHRSCPIRSRLRRSFVSRIPLWWSPQT